MNEELYQDVLNHGQLIRHSELEVFEHMFEFRVYLYEDFLHTITLCDHCILSINTACSVEE